MARQMKDSGVEWIGEIPDTWSLSRVGSYISLVESGVSVNAGINPAGEGELGVLKTSCVSTGKFNPDENKAVNKDEVGRVGCPVRAGCLIVSRMNTPGLVGACGYVEQSYPNIYLPDRLWQIHVNPGYSAKFAYYYLTSSLARSFYASIAVGTSSSMQNISQKEFSSMRCTCPPYVEQERIAIFLDAKCAEIDKVVEQTRATIEEYKKLKQAIITEAVTKGVRGPRPMKPSGVEWIGDIPAEWTVSTLGKVTSSMRNGYVGPTRDLFVDDGVRYIQSLHIKDGKIDLSQKAYFVRPEWAAERPKVSTGDILIVQTGDIGQVGLVTEEYHECSCHALIIASPNKSDISSEYLAYFLRSTVGRELLLAHKTGALLPHLNSGKIRFAEVVHPNTIEEQKETTAYLDTKCAEIDRIIEKKEQLISELGSYKKSLIYEYVTGKKEVKTNMELKVPYSN